MLSRAHSDPCKTTQTKCGKAKYSQATPHACMFKQGRDLGTLEKAWLGATGREGVAGSMSLSECEEVYCCVKTYMRVTMLQHAIVLVLPYARQEQLVDEPREVCARHPLSKYRSGPSWRSSSGTMACGRQLLQCIH